MADELLTVQELARRLRVSVRTVRRMVAEGRTPEPVRLAGTGRGALRFRASDIAAWIKWGLPTQETFRRMREAERSVR